MEEEVRTKVIDKVGTAREHGAGESVFMPYGSRFWAYIVVQRRDEWAEYCFDRAEEGGAYVDAGVYNAEGTCCVCSGRRKGIVVSRR